MELVRQINVITKIAFPMVDADGDTVKGIGAAGTNTLTASYSKFADGAAPTSWTTTGTDPTETPSNNTTGIYYIPLLAAEVNAEFIYIKIADSGAVAKDQHILIRTTWLDPHLQASVGATPANCRILTVPASGNISADALAISTSAPAANNLETAALAYSVTRGLAGTALPAAVADAAGGLPISNAGGLDMDAILVDTGTTLQAELDAIQAAVITNAAGADVAADIIALKAETVEILADTGTTLQGELDAIQAAVITNAAGDDVAADIIALKAETVEILADTGTTLQGELDAIQAAVITNAAGDDVAADIIALKAETVEILADTGTTIPATLGTPANIDAGGATIADNLKKIADDNAGATFDATNHSLAAIRVQGDAAWSAAATVSEMLQVVPSIPESIDLAGTAVYRLALYLVNPTDNLPSAVEITPGTISIAHKAYGGTTWTDIVTDSACSEAAGMIYKDVAFASANYAAGDSIRITFKSQKVTVSANDQEITGTSGWIFYTYIRRNATTLGEGAIKFTYTVYEDEEDGAPIADVDVWVTSDIDGANVIASGITNDDGEVIFYLDAGDKYLWRQKTGYTFTNPDTETVV